MTRTRVLMSAYACGPGRGSEPGIGWNTAREMAAHHDVWLVTSRENRALIEEELASRPIPQLHVVFHDWPASFEWIKRWRIGYEVQHYLWQVGAYILARRLHRRVAFDLAHHVTMGRYWAPSFMAMLPVPFVWGPVGGGESVPRGFLRGLGCKGAAVEVVRAWARWLGERDPFLAVTARRSVLALATTEESRRRMVRLGARSPQVMSQVGLSDAELDQLASYAVPPAPPVRFISVGRLLHWKGFHIGLSAFARLGAVDAEYWIVGSGPARAQLTRLARQLGIADRVRFCGGLARRDTLACLQQAHVLVHPSLHESGGMVIVEAMAAGRPVVCLDLGGPALQVTPETGFKIAPSTPDATIDGVADAMRRLCDSSELRARMGAAARVRAREFAWRHRADLLSRLYSTVNRDDLFAARQGHA